MSCVASSIDIQKGTCVPVFLKKLKKHYVINCIDPLDPKQHSDELMNIVTGQVVTQSTVNVNTAVLQGKTLVKSV